MEYKIRSINPEHYDLIKKVTMLQHKFDKLSGHILIYGAGVHLRYLVTWLELSDFSIRVL